MGLSPDCFPRKMIIIYRGAAVSVTVYIPYSIIFFALKLCVVLNAKSSVVRICGKRKNWQL